MPSTENFILKFPKETKIDTSYDLIVVVQKNGEHEKDAMQQSLPGGVFIKGKGM